MRKKSLFQRCQALILAIVMILGLIMVPDNNTLKAEASGTDASVSSTVAPGYSVEISSGQEGYYPEETYSLKATVKDDTNGVEITETDYTNLVWEITEGATAVDISSSYNGRILNFTVKKGTSEGTAIKVKAKYSDGVDEYVNETTLTTGVRAVINIHGLVTDSFDNKAVVGAEVTFTQNVIPLNKTISVITNDKGEYSATLYKDIPYSISVSGNGYNLQNYSNESFAADTLDRNFSMQIAGTMEIIGQSDITFGQYSELSASLKDIADAFGIGAGDVEWKLISDTTDGVLSASKGEHVTFTPSKAGAVTLKAGVHGVEKEFVINVAKQIPVLDVTVTPEGKADWYTGVRINAVLKNTNGVGIENQTLALIIDGVEVTTDQKKMITDADGKAEFIWKSENGVKNEGKYSIEISYSGNDGQYGEKNWKLNDDYSLDKLDQTFHIANVDTPNAIKHLTYGDDYYIQIDDIKPADEGIDGALYGASKTFSFVIQAENGIDGNDYVSIGNYDETKKGYPLTVLKGGAENIKINITQEANKYYNASSQTLTIGRIDKKEVSLTDVKAKDKNYDGNASISVSATLNLSDVEDGDKEIAKQMVLSSAGTADDVNAGERNVAVTPFIIPLNSPLYGKYYLANGGKPTDTVTVVINKVILEVAVGDAKIDYTKLYDAQLLDFGSSEPITVTGFVNGEETSLPSGYEEPSVYIVDITEDLKVGKKYSVLKAMGGNPGNNYVFDFVNDSDTAKIGELTLQEEQVSDYHGYISYNGGNHTYGFYEDVPGGETKLEAIYYSADEPVAKFTVGKSPYTRIILVNDRGSEKDITDAGIDYNEIEGHSNYSVYLCNGNADGSDKTLWTSKFKLPQFLKDSQEPQVSIEIEAVERGFDKFLSTLTFGLYKNANNSVEAQINVSDIAVEGEVASGISQWSYCVAYTDKDVDLASDPNTGVITFEQWNEVFGNQKFTTVSPSEGLSKSVSIDTKADNNYIIFVMVTDNVGNTCIYGSNGIIVENVNPMVVDIQYDTQVEEGATEGYYKNNVKLNIAVEENTKDCIYSGIASISVKLTEDGVEVPADNSGIVFEQGAPNTTLADLKDNYSKVNASVQVPCPEPKASKQIVATFTVTDFAGNTAIQDKGFVIDPIAPVITSEYSAADAEKAGVTYYQGDVVLKTTIRERFLDIANNVKYIINGNEVTLGMLSQSNDLSGYGIKTIEIDHNNEGRTDESESVITIVFSPEGRYDISASVQDMAGSTASTDTYSFIIDKTDPKVKITYTDVSSKMTFVPSKDADKITYLNAKSSEGIRVDICVEDANFDPKYNNDLIIQASNIIKNDGEIVEIPELQWRRNETNHIGTLFLAKDANYTLDFVYSDLSGRKADFIMDELVIKTYGKDFLTLDREMPTGNIKVTDLVNNEDGNTLDWFNKFINTISFGIFGQASVTATIESTDKTSGVATMAYLTTDVEGLTVAALEKMDWKSYKSDERVDLGANQNLFIYARVEDKAGNVAYYSTDYISIDNQESHIGINTSPLLPGRNKGVYNAEEIKAFSIHVEEPSVVTKTDYFSGLKVIGYKITARDDSGKIENIIVGENDGYKELISYGRDKHNNTYDGEVQFNVLADRSCHYTIDIHVEDWSGNIAEKTMTIIIDSKKPEIDSVVTSEADKLNGKYYKKDVVFSTTITERYLDIYKDVIYVINNHTVALEDLIANKDKYGVSSVTVTHDNNELGRMDSTNSRIDVIFHDDNNYSVSTYVTDKAGNRSDETEKAIFVVDQTAPKATLTYYSYGNGALFDAGKSANDIKYLGEDYSSFKAEVTVEELNFTDGSTVNADYIVHAKDSENKDILKDKLTGYTDNAKAVKSWQDSSETIHKYSVDINDDANYTFDFAYTDLAGNPLQVEVSTDYITLDRERPTGTVTINGLVNGTADSGTATSKSWVSKFIESVTFGLFGKDGLSADMESEDVTAGVALTQYLYTSEYLTREKLALRTDWTDYTGTIGLNANQNVIVYQKVVDKAGNTEYYSTDHLIADNVDPAPVVTITPSSPSWNKGVYSAGDNPGFDISVTDPVVNEAYSGLKDITYKIVNGTNGYTEEGTLAAIDRNTHQQSWTGHVSINPEAFYSNDVQVTVTASDWSTNKATSETARLKVDNKAPIVKFSFDTSDAFNGKYYKNNKTLTITVDERNFDPSYTPTVTSTAGGGYSFSGWSTNGEISTGTITFSGDSDYTVTFDCYDLAGNKSNTERQEEFTVDKTLPTISVAYDNNSVLNGKYYKAPRTATITITEHNFRASEVRVTTTAALNGGVITAPAAGGWSSYGDRHTAVVSFPGDGDYTFDITYTDLAGNTSADYAQDGFTVDKTNPELEISGVKDKSANKGTVAPIITLSDVNFDSENIVLTLTGANKGKVPVDGMVTRSNRAGGATISFKNFGKDMDDIYTLTAKTTDKAGNDTSKTITFSVNRNGSTYMINEATQKLLDTGFTNNPQNLVIQEINVDTLKFVELTYSKDGQVVKLTEGKDYTVKAEGGDGQWKKYTYTIFASCFEEEGEYTINIYSEDRAANTTTNKVKGKSIEFIVDKTPPTVSIANLENRGRYREDVHQFTLSVKDNTVLSYVELYLDGELVHTYTGDELNVVDGVLTIDVDSKASYQSLKLIAYDAAGNPTDPIEYEVLVTSSWWVQFFMNKPLFFGVIAAIVIVAGGVGLLIVKRKKAKK